MLSESELSELEGLLAKATPGGWVREGNWAWRTPNSKRSNNGFHVGSASCRRDVIDVKLIVALINLAPRLIAQAREKQQQQPHPQDDLSVTKGNERGPEAGSALPSPTVAEQLFEARLVECRLEDALDDAGVVLERLGWDYYDCSLEICGVPPDQRLSEVAQRIVFDAGFMKLYVNHTDKWETHYSFGKEFSKQEGWRVSYPHKRNDWTPSILVEKPVATWPQKWFDTGYVRIVELGKGDAALARRSDCGHDQMNQTQWLPEQGSTGQDSKP